jgi:hypothetical protein
MQDAPPRSDDGLFRFTLEFADRERYDAAQLL